MNPKKSDCFSLAYYSDFPSISTQKYIVMQT